MPRPADHRPPDHLTPTTPVPQPSAGDEPIRGRPGKDDPLDPTRYGDWENKGVAIDF